MRLFEILRLLDPAITPDRCKLHLAVWNGTDDPLDQYLAGQFDDWQNWQSKQNFNRDFVVPLIKLPQPSHWLFAGAHESHGSDWIQEQRAYRYRMVRRNALDELDGRLVAHFERPGRQSYLLCENWDEALTVAEIRAEKLRIGEFPGFSRAMLTKQNLDLVIQQQVESWKTALASVAGVYVIADRHTGKLYIGSATGNDGIWCRWCAYSCTGHGGNRELIDLLAAKGADYANNFQFGVLEIFDTHASETDVRGRESYWKNLLLTRSHGYNAN